MKNERTKEYEEGYNAWDLYAESNFITKTENPYEHGTEQFRSWNRGWNSNPNGVNKYYESLKLKK